MTERLAKYLKQVQPGYTFMVKVPGGRIIEVIGVHLEHQKQKSARASKGDPISVRWRNTQKRIYDTFSWTDIQGPNYDLDG